MGNARVSDNPDERDVFQALADPTRRAILTLLQQGSQPVGGIARGFPISRPAISRHLRILREADLVTETIGSRITATCGSTSSAISNVMSK